FCCFFFSSRRRHTRFSRDWSSDVCSSDLAQNLGADFLTTFRRIVLPIAAPGVAAGTLLVFILCMNAYATPVLLGGTGLTMMAPRSEERRVGKECRALRRADDYNEEHRRQV